MSRTSTIGITPKGKYSKMKTLKSFEELQAEWIRRERKQAKAARKELKRRIACGK